MEYGNETFGGSQSADATKALQSYSNVIDVDEEKINSDINTINNQTIKDQSRERQVYIGLSVNNDGDTPTATLTSVIWPPGESGNEVYTGMDEKRTGPNLSSRKFKGTSLMPIAQAHTHNLVGEGKENTVRTSDYRDYPDDGGDKGQASRQKITVYAIDSWTGTSSNGNAIHSVNVRVNVSNTNSKNIGQDALNQIVKD